MNNNPDEAYNALFRSYEAANRELAELKKRVVELEAQLVERANCCGVPGGGAMSDALTKLMNLPVTGFDANGEETVSREAAAEIVQELLKQ